MPDCLNAALTPPGPSTAAAPLHVRVYPNPWRTDKHTSSPKITFVPSSGNCTVKIFTASGHLVKTVGPMTGEIPWDLTNESGHPAASGVYLYLITDSQGNKQRGQVAIIR